MSIVMTMDKTRFMDEMKQYWESLSYDGAEALYNYYEELSDSTGEPFEFDGVAIRCDWSEYEHLGLAKLEYDDNNEVGHDAVVEWFNDRTTLIELDNGHVLVQAF